MREIGHAQSLGGQFALLNEATAQNGNCRYSKVFNNCAGTRHGGRTGASTADAAYNGVHLIVFEFLWQLLEHLMLIRSMDFTKFPPADEFYPREPLG